MKNKNKNLQKNQHECSAVNIPVLHHVIYQPLVIIFLFFYFLFFITMVFYHFFFVRKYLGDAVLIVFNSDSLARYSGLPSIIFIGLAYMEFKLETGNTLCV